MKLRLIPLFLIGIYATGSLAAPAAGVPAASDKALPVLASVPGTPAAAAAPAAGMRHIHAGALQKGAELFLPRKGDARFAAVLNNNQL